MDKVRLYIFHIGKVRVDRAIPLHERDPLAVTGLFRSKAKRMILPVSAYLPESFSAHTIPGFTVDNQLAEKSLDWLIQCKNDPACMGVFVNHDPTVPEQELEVTL